MDKKSKILVIPIFVPHAGCPHDCIFCNQKIISGQTESPDKNSIIKTIENYRPVKDRYTEVELAFYGGSFTAIEPYLQEYYLETVQPYLKSNGGFIDFLRCSTRPDAIDESVILRLKKYGVKIVELGAQSMDDTVLEIANRGHFAEDTKRASILLKNNGFILGLQTMPGLPGASRESDIQTAIKIAGLNPDFVRIYPTITIRHTKMFEMYQNGEYLPPSLDEMVKLCACISDIYLGKGIDIIRMGLQSSDNISETGEIAAGPYHPAFGELVYSYKIYLNILSAIDNFKFDGNENEYALTVKVPPEKLSLTIGQKKQNLKKLSQIGFGKVKIIADETVSDFEVNIGK